MTSFVAKVYDGSDVLLGPGPVYHVLDPTVTERLDEAGEVSFSVPAADDRVGETLEDSSARTVELVYLPPNGTAAESVGWGIRRGGSRQLELRPEGLFYRYALPSPLMELAWAATCPQHDYDPAQLLSNIMSPHVISGDMKGLLHPDYGAIGWDHGTIAGGTYHLEFNGESVLEAIRTSCERWELHFRETPGELRKLDVGPFGTSSGIRLHQATAALHSLGDDERVMYMTGLEMSEDRDEIVNWVMPLGAEVPSTGRRLSLEYSTRASPYTIQTMTDPNGNTRYFIADATSTAAYGERREVWIQNQVAADSDDPADLEAAANELYDLAAAHVQSLKDANVTYRCDVVDPSGENHGASVAVGDLVRAVYRGLVKRHGTPYQIIDIDEEIMVMSRARRWERTGRVAYTLELSTAERLAVGNARLVRRIGDWVRTLVLVPG